MANNPRENILVVENDPVIGDLIARQVLRAAGYQAEVVAEAASALTRAAQSSPDLIIANLSLPGLSGKDLMVALQSQGLDIPVLMLAGKGMEKDVIQAFRLGAADYLMIPAREAEVLSAVERALKQVRGKRERERLAQDLQKSNQDLQSRINELTTIYSIGKAVTSITDQSLLFERIMQGFASVTKAERVWLLLRDEQSGAFVLAAHHGLPPSLAEQINRPWDDGISSLVTMSGETLAIHGEALRRFKIAPLGQAAIIIPVKARKQVIGLLSGMRKKDQPFRDSEQRLLEALADYASVSLVNARLFRAVEERAAGLQSLVDKAQNGEKRMENLLRTVQEKAHNPLQAAVQAVRLLESEGGKLSAYQRQSFATLHSQLAELERILKVVDGGG